MLITIRRMEEKDAESVAAIEKEVFSEPWPMEAFAKAADGRDLCPRQPDARPAARGRQSPVNAALNSSFLLFVPSFKK